MTDFDDFARELQSHFIEQARNAYTETVVDHWMHPRNQRALVDPDGRGKITGPCGDTMEIFLRVENRRVVEASFLTDGCITSIACGSMAVAMISGQPLARAHAITQNAVLDELGGLPEESQHCALLAALTVRAAVDDHLHGGSGSWRDMYRTKGPSR